MSRCSKPLPIQRRATHRLTICSAAVLLSLAAFAGGQSLWISGKAFVAQHLLERAWRSTLRTHHLAKPWPWADIAPVAKLNVPTLDLSLLVLGDASGEAMAFGPGLVAGRIAAADSEVIALGGHRDTHLAFLENLPSGSAIRLQTSQGIWHNYRLRSSQVVDSRSNTVTIARNHPGLVLITCYPFNAMQTGGPLRYMITAQWQPDSPASTAKALRLPTQDKQISAPLLLHTSTKQVTPTTTNQLERLL